MRNFVQSSPSTYVDTPAAYLSHTSYPAARSSLAVALRRAPGRVSPASVTAPQSRATVARDTRDERQALVTHAAALQPQLGEAAQGGQVHK